MSFKVEIKKSETFPEVLVLKPDIYYDYRGEMWTTFDKKTYDSFLNGLEFHHFKFSSSRKNVLRGLHGDNLTWKLVTCIYGEFYSVVADPRKDFPTYGKWESFICNDRNHLQILIPPKFLNGYLVLSDWCVYHYALSYPKEYVDYDKQIHVKWNDPLFKIDWPIKNPILHWRDR